MAQVTEPPANRPDPDTDVDAESAPEADRLEQLAPLTSGDDEYAPPTTAPYEADEGDALEQSMEVPLDDDYPPDA